MDWRDWTKTRWKGGISRLWNRYGLTRRYTRNPKFGFTAAREILLCASTSALWFPIWTMLLCRNGTARFCRMPPPAPSVPGVSAGWDAKAREAASRLAKGVVDALTLSGRF